MSFWTKQSIERYDAACKLVQYPKNAIGEKVTEFIRPDDVVMDVGAGCGAVSAFLSPFCKKIYALESDDFAFEYLQNRVLQDKLNNVFPIFAQWPAENLPQVSIIIGCYVGGLAKTPAQVKSVMDSAQRGGMFLINRDMGFHHLRNEILDRIGVTPEEDNFSCKSGCQTVGMLSMMGAKVSCHPVTHDFGQPIQDEEEATHFLWRKLYIDERHKKAVRQIIEDYITEKDGIPFVPFIRESCLIFFEIEK